MCTIVQQVPLDHALDVAPKSRVNVFSSKQNLVVKQFRNIQMKNDIGDACQEICFCFSIPKDHSHIYIFGQCY